MERLVVALGKPSSWPDTEDLSARADGPGDSYTRLWEERAELAQRLDELQAELAEEQRKHGEAVAKGARREEELERVAADQQALAGQVAQSRAELADARTQDEHLTQRVSELETELRLAEERAAKAVDLLRQAETDSERRREHERSLAEELQVRQVELSVRSAELDSRETAVADTERRVEDRRRALAEELKLRQGELSVRSAALAELASRLETLRGTASVSEARRPARQDEHLLIIASNHGYRLVARRGAVPDPGEVVELEDGRYRCLRISMSPFLWDNRPRAVLEPVTDGSEP
jgi:exonuclease SbcC